MNRSIVPTPSNKRVFGACLLSLMTLLAPIAAVGAATRRALVPLTVNNAKATESAEPSLVEPAAAMPAPAPVPAPAPMPAVGPITATKADSFPDPDGDGKADLGSTISYTIGISNTGSDAATGVTFDDVYDANTTLVAGSLNVSPLAIDESYTAVGNTLLEVGNATAQTGPQKTVAGGVLSNGDTEYLGDTFTISTFDATSAFGGTVTMVTTGPDAGAFTYISAANYTGPDSFTYTLRDDGTDGIPGNSDDLTGIGTVTITVANQVWYVDGSFVGTSDGRSTTPYKTLAEVSGPSGADTTGDIIYLNTGTYSSTTGITLLDTQTLHGEGTALIVGGDTLAAAGTDPTITSSAGSGVTLASGNTLTGFTVGNTTVYDITNTAATSVGALNISNVVLNGSGNLFKADSGGALTVTFESAAATSAVTTGILIAGGATGSFSVAGTTTIDDATTDGISISNSAASATFTGAVTILNDGGANGDGVDLLTNSGIYSFNGGLSITVNGTGAFGFRAQSSGTVNIVDVGTTQITSNAGTALLINPTTLNATLDTITSGGGADGISLSGMSGSLTVGSVSINGQSVDGIDITNSAGTVTINGGTIGNTNDPTGAGVDISGGAGNVTISATINKTTAGDVVEISGRTGGTVDFNGNLTSTAAAGVDLTSNTSGTIRFDGGMTLSTGATAAFSSTASTGGTVIVTDPAGATNNTLTTTSGIALNVANTTIGAEDLTFQSISAGTGAGSAGVGISLISTGTAGGLTVTGNGGTCTSAATCTGGTIQHKTGSDSSTTGGIGIYLNNTSQVSLSFMHLNDFDNQAIFGQSVGGIKLLNSRLGGVIGTSTGSNDSVISFGTTDPGGTNGFLNNSSSLIDNVDISGSIEHNVEVYQQSGTFNLTIQNSNIHDNNSLTGSDGLLIETSGTAHAIMLVQDTIFDDDRSQAVQANALGTSFLELTLDDNDILSTTQGNEGFVLQNGASGDFTVAVTNNTFTGINGTNVLVGNVVNNATSASELNATVSGNTMTLDGPSVNRTLIAFFSSTIGQVSTSKVLIDGNTINTIADPVNGLAESLFVSTPDANTDPLAYATVSNNVVNIDDDNDLALRGIAVQSTQDTSVMHADVRGNDVNYLDGAPAGINGIRVRQVAPATLDLEPGVGGANASAVLANNNPLSTTEIVGTVTVSANNNTALLPSSPATPTLPSFLMVARGGVEALLNVLSQETGNASERYLPGADSIMTPFPLAAMDTFVFGSSIVTDALSQEHLNRVVSDAIERWIATGLTSQQIDTLRRMKFEVGDLGGSYLGESNDNLVTIDRDAGGRGWYARADAPSDFFFNNPVSETRRYTDARSAPAGHIDLLTAIEHEMGHKLGLDDSYAEKDRDSLMFGYLTVGERRLPARGQAATAKPGTLKGAHFLSLSRGAKLRPVETNNNATVTRSTGPLAPMPPLTTVNIGTLPGNKSLTIVFQVTVNTTGLGTATSVSNQGTVSGSNFANVLTDDQPGTAAPNEPTVTPISRLDLEVTKTDGVTTATPGSPLHYLITYTNLDHAANGVVLTETVPTGTTKATDASGWSCPDGSVAGTMCTINLGNLPRNGVAGYTGTRTFSVTVNNPTAAGLNDIVNTASIAHDGSYEADMNPANNTTTDTDTLNAAPDLNISKTDGVLTTTPGSTLTYTINYSNVGTQNAAGVVLTETVPAGTTFVAAGSSAWTGVGCVNGAPAGTVCTINVGTLNAGAPAASATFVVLVTNPAPAGLDDIVNTASIADDGTNGTDPTLPNTATDTDTLDAAPDLTISKVADVPDVAPGETIVYTITYANTFNQNATGVVITETVPLNTTFSTADSAPTVWSCADNSPAGTVCTTTIGALAGGGSGGTVKFGVVVDDPTLATQVSNTATITDDGGNGADPNPGNNTTGAVITPILVCTPPPANMTNWWTGDDTARDIAGGKDGTLNGDDGPADLEYSAGKVLNGFDFDGINDLVNVGDVDLPSTFTIDAWVNPTSLSVERAIVSKDDGAAQRSYFLHITTGGALRASVNSAGGFTVYQTADGVITTGSLQHVAVTYDGAAAAGQKMLFYKNGVLVASTVQSSQDAGGTPENNSLAALIGRSATTNNTFLGVIDEVEFFSRVLAASELLAIFTADSGGKCKPPDLRITKTHADPFVQGSSGNTYTITVHNDGPGTTSGNVNVLDDLPAGLTATSMSGSGWACTPIPMAGTPGPAALACTSTAPIASGADFPAITLTVNAAANMGTSVTNSVTVSGGGEMDTSDNSDDDPTTLQPSADLSITKTDGTSDEVPGTSITYTITVTNSGPSNVTGATVADTFPGTITGVTYTSVAAGGATGNTAAGSGNISDTVNMPSGSTITYTATGTISSSATGSLANTATVTAPGGTTDPDTSNNSATDTDTLSRVADLQITKTDGTTDEVPGSSITYTITVTNAGPSDVNGATVADTFPPEITGVTYTSVAGGGATGNTAAGSGNISDTVNMPSGSSITYTVSGTISPSATGSLSNTATVTAPGGTTDPDTANNSATDTDTLVVTADLSITKTDGQTSEVPGTAVSYTIVVTNNGPSNVTGATVADTFPAEITGVTYTSVAAGGATGNTSPGAGNISDTVDMPSGSTITYTVSGTISPSATGSLANTATVTAPGGTTDPDTSNNSATDTDTLTVTADLSITKTDGLTDEVPGTAVSYTIVVTNNGPSNVTGATVADTFPATITGVTYTSVAAGGATGNTAAGAGNISDTVNMPSGSTITYTVSGTISPSATGSLSNTATVTAPGGTTDPDTSNNSATDTDTLTGSADLEISKIDTPDPVTAGNNITYTISFENNGVSDAQTVTVTDAVPANTTFVSAAITLGPGWSISSQPAVGGTGNVVFSKATVAAGETATFQVVVKVNSSTPGATSISNDATAASATTDPTPGNNTGNATTTVVTSADLLVVKIDSPDPVPVGQNLTYTITVSNGGSSDAQNLSLSDTLPPNTTFVSFTVPAGWTRTDVVPVGGTGTVTATAPTLASGANAVFTLVVNVNAATPHNTVLTNSATATSTTTDPDPVNNTGTVMTTVVSQPDLTITKTHAGDFAQGQVGATYTITVSNSGSGPTNGSPVTVTDNVPVGLTPTGPIGAHNGWTCAINGQTLTCTRSDVLAGNSSYPPITLTVNVANPAPLTVTNTATVSGGGEVNTSNNSDSDLTEIDCTVDNSLNNTNPLMISRFRMNGPAGTQDEFVEIYNPTTTDHTVAAGNCASGGYGVLASAGNGTNSNTLSLVCQIPNGTVIPAGGYYLCTGVTYSLGNLGRNGGVEGETSVGDAPIGCDGACTDDIPNDAGLALMNVQGGVTIVGPGFSGPIPDPGFVIYDRVGFGPYGAGAPPPGNGYPSGAPNFCEGGACLKPVGDASTGACANPSGLFPVLPVPPACYGMAGQYEIMRRQTIFNANLGTVHADTNNNANDFILVAPNSSSNMGVTVTGVSGVTAVHGAAGPQNSSAPSDFPQVVFKQGPFDDAKGQLVPPNAERNFGLDPTVANPANAPLGTFALRLRFTNNSAGSIAGLRFRVDNLSTLCGPQSATPTVGTGVAKNLSATAPDCGTGSFTAILKLLNSAQEVVVDSTSTAQAVTGTVMEDLSASATPTPPGAGALSPTGGGLDNSIIVNPSFDDASVGDGVTGGSGVFATSISTTDPTNVIRIRIKFGVVKSGRFILLIMPAAKTAP